MSEDTKQPRRMTEQEENWHIMNVIGIPWSECKKLDEGDRLFLMSRVQEIHQHQMQQQQPQETEEQEGPRKVFKYD